MSCQSSGQLMHRVLSRLIGQFESSPMNAQGQLCLQMLHDGDGLGGICVLGGHEPSRIISANGQERDINSPELLPQPAKNIARAIAGVARKIDQPAGRFQHESAP